MPSIMKVWMYKRFKNGKKEVEQLVVRRSRVCSSTFNIAAYSDQMSLKYLRFRVIDISKIEELLHFTGGISGWRGMSPMRCRYFHCSESDVGCVYLVGSLSNVWDDDSRS